MPGNTHFEHWISAPRPLLLPNTPLMLASKPIAESSEILPLMRQNRLDSVSSNEFRTFGAKSLQEGGTQRGVLL
jgi:hypothetical protein